MSLRIGRLFFRPSPLIATALLIHTCTALAADAAGDLQQQMRELLAGGITTQSAQPSQWRDDRTVSRTADVLELERRLLLGATDYRAQGAQATAGSDSAAGVSTVKRDLFAHDDAQSSARRLLLGR
jgi:hypothetical protein